MMSRSKLAAMGAITVIAVASGAAGLLRHAEAQNTSASQASRSKFMRLKLDYAKDVLEGLSLEKLDQVAEGGRRLAELSAAAQWEVPTVPAAEFNTYTAEFQRIAKELSAEATEKDLDGATLAYVRLTMSCVNCHKFVRRQAR